MNRPSSLFQRVRWKLRGYVPFSNWWIVWRKLDKSAESILDLGCGVGSPMTFLNRHKQFHTVGIDGFEPYINQCREIKSHDILLQGDIKDLPYEANSFDIVIALQVLEHLDKPDGEELLRNMERIARKQIIVTTDINEYVQGVINGNKLQIHKYIWTIKELQDWGFKTFGVSLKGYGGTTGYSHFLPEFPRWAIATALQPIIGLFVYHFPKYAGAAVCIKNLEGDTND